MKNYSKSKKETNSDDENTIIEEESVGKRMEFEASSTSPRKVSKKPKKPKKARRPREVYKIKRKGGIRVQLFAMFFSRKYKKKKRMIANLADSRIGNLIMGRILIIDKAVLMFCILCLGLCMLEYDQEFFYHPDDPETDTYLLKAVPFSYLIMLISLFLSLMNYIRQAIIIKYDRMINDKPPRKTWWYRIFKVMESLLILVHPSPFLIGYQIPIYNRVIGATIYYNVNDFMHLAQIYKVYLIVRSLLIHSKYQSPRAQRVCHMYGFNTGINYVIKCFMQTIPIRFVTIAFLLGVVSFAYAIRIAEAPITRRMDDMNLFSFLTCIWAAMVTMTTVGYGDIYPRTTFGRIIIFFCSLYGVSVVSLIVVVVTDLLEMNTNERKVYTVMERLLKREDLKETASKLFGAMAEVKKAKVMKAGNKLAVAEKRLAKLTKEFRQMRQTYKEINDSNMREDMIKKFFDANERLIKFKTKMNRMREQYRMETLGGESVVANKAFLKKSKLRKFKLEPPKPKMPKDSLLIVTRGPKK